MPQIERLAHTLGRLAGSLQHHTRHLHPLAAHVEPDFTHPSKYCVVGDTAAEGRIILDDILQAMDNAQIEGKNTGDPAINPYLGLTFKQAEQKARELETRTAGFSLS